MSLLKGPPRTVRGRSRLAGDYRIVLCARLLRCRRGLNADQKISRGLILEVRTGAGLHHGGEINRTGAVRQACPERQRQDFALAREIKGPSEDVAVHAGPVRINNRHAGRQGDYRLARRRNAFVIGL